MWKYRLFGEGNRMKVNLAGFNIDKKIIENSEMTTAYWNAMCNIEKGNSSDLPIEFTPETISAAYARISRSKKDVDELRADAIKDVAKARGSNENIVYGMGHSSISEHAVVNLDLIDVSRLAIEFIEAFRLASYTEKSQRYVKLNGKDFHMPQEIIGTEFEDEFRKVVDVQNQTYIQIYNKVKRYLMKQGLEKKDAVGKAKEDARYVTCLATYGQLGITANARTVENLLRRFNANPLNEVKNIGDEVAYKVVDHIPSLIKHTTATPIDRYSVENYFREPRFVHDHSTLPDDLLFLDAHCPINFTKYFPTDFIFGSLGVHDAIPREWEFMSFTFGACVSASCYAQLKRHRMGFSMIPYKYDIGNGVTIPQNIVDAEVNDIFMEAIDKTNEFYNRLNEFNPMASQYILTQAHKRWVMCQMNGRELYHFARLRMDGHAQWDIRNLATRLVEKAINEFPDTLQKLCGKDQFE